jgi:hypothetical protein
MICHVARDFSPSSNVVRAEILPSSAGVTVGGGGPAKGRRRTASSKARS